MSKCLILGANGFIGSHLVDSLIARGHNVRAFDRKGSNPNYEANENIELFIGDFLNRDDLSNALKGVDYVFHFISTTTPASAENDPLIDIETNIKMSVILFQECVNSSIKKVIFSSTGGAIYGESSDKPFKETDLTQPISPYALAKLTIERYLKYFNVKHGLDSISLRISNPYGERQPKNRKQGVIPIFMENIINNEPITILGDGSMIRDYIYVKDVAEIIADIFQKKSKNNVYNIGSGVGISLNELVSNIEKVTGRVPEKLNKTAPSTYVHKVVLETSRLNDEFNVKSYTNLQDGLSATWNNLVNEQQGGTNE